MSTRPPIGLLLAQLGTPDAPTVKALKAYLRQFLSDPRVIDLPRWKWLPILHLFILTRRPARSAALYQNIWRPEGSPLMIYSQAQTAGLQKRLGGQYRVVLGMRYGQPSIARAMAQLAGEGIDRTLVFPMFPQFSASTTGSIYDAVNQASSGRRMPALRWVPPYYDHPSYIDALKTVYRQSLDQLDQPPDRHLITFHGIPQRYVDEGDPYRSQCESTARLLARALELADDQWLIGFQSRFGKEPWLEPYSEDILLQLGGQGVSRVAATCPGFTADCLETLDEIGREGQEQFHQGGGRHLHLVPCLNDDPAWLDAMAVIARQETAGWTA